MYIDNVKLELAKIICNTYCTTCGAKNREKIVKDLYDPGTGAPVTIKECPTGMCGHDGGDCRRWNTVIAHDYDFSFSIKNLFKGIAGVCRRCGDITYEV